ncbi:MAG: outer membrane protein transport protein [Elusimicrobiota bacterium]|jgi:long-chain fatty acid transport protein|nr:outer membrane protein transport protein [Elusimicrobiota bacterium]
MKNMIKAVALSLSLAFIGSAAMGAGFALYEFSARGNAMGGAVMANKAEAASMAVNPALITELDGLQVQAGATFVAPASTTSFAAGLPAGGERDLKSKVFTLPNFYTTYKASEAVSLGLAVFSRFGLGGEYENPNPWLGSASAYKFDVQTISATPVVAAKVSDDISVAMGLEFMDISFSEDKYLNGTGAAPFSVEGDGMSWGGVFGISYKPEWAEKKLGFGLSYRTKTRQVLDGTLKAPSMGFANADVRGSVTLPDAVNLGVSYQFTPKFLIETGIIGTFWSSMDAIRIEVPTAAAAPAQGLMLIEQKDYKDVVRFNLGAEYALTDNWDIRGGYVFDQSPTNKGLMDTLVPVGDRHLFNLGLGYHRDNWGVDAAYTYLLGKKMNGTGHLPDGTAVPVKYTNGSSHMFGITFKYTFDVPLLRS